MYKKRWLLYYVFGFIVVFRLTTGYRLKPNIFFMVSNVSNVQLLDHSDNYLAPTVNLDRLANEGIKFENCFGIGITANEFFREMFVGKGDCTKSSLLENDFDINIIANKFYNLGYQIAVIGDSSISKHGIKCHYYLNPNSNTDMFGVVESKGRSYAWSCIDGFAAKVNQFLSIREKSKPFMIILCQNFNKNKIDDSMSSELNVTSCNSENFGAKSLAKINSCDFLKGKNLEPDFKVAYTSVAEVPSKIVRNYFSAILSIDLSLGQAIKSLQENNELNNTILISALIKQKDLNIFSNDIPRMDLIIRYPKIVKAGVRSDAICLSTDLYPTILDLCNENTPDELKSNSLLPILRSEGREPHGWRNFVCFENRDKNGNKYMGVLTKKYKLINKSEFNKWELYDLQIDPFAKNNVYYFSHYDNVRDSLMNFFRYTE